MKRYGVTIPVAGHAYVTVEAESEQEAIDLAMYGDVTKEDIEDWDCLRAFNRGNVCSCPHPWEVEAEELEE
jgi:hypothetical protein